MVGKFLLGMVSGGLVVTGGLVVASMLAPTRPANDNAPEVAMEEPIALPKATTPEAGATVAEPKAVAAQPTSEAQAPAVAASEPAAEPAAEAPTLLEEAPAAPVADAADPAPAPDAPVAEVAAPETSAEPSKPATTEADVAATPDPATPPSKAATAETADPSETEIADAGATTAAATPEVPAPKPEPAPTETPASADTSNGVTAPTEPAALPATDQPADAIVAEPAPALDATALPEPAASEPAPTEPAPAEPAVTEPASEAPAAQAPALDAPEPETAAEPSPVVEAPAPATPDVEAPASDSAAAETVTEPQPQTPPTEPSAPELPVGEVPAAEPAADAPVADAPADTMPAPADAAPGTEAPEMPGTKPAPLPGVTEPAEAPAIVVAEDDGSKTFKPTPGLIKSGEGVIIGRDKPAENAPIDPNAAPVDPRPIARFASEFDNQDAKPPFAIILVDPGSPDLDRAGLAALPFPVSFALDPLDPATPQRAATYRAGGKEVVMLVTGIADGAQASDVEVAFQAMEQGLPEAVAAMELVTPAFQNNRGLATAVVPILKAQGRGLLTWDEGLNAADQVARRDDLEAAVVFRNLDQAGGDKVAVRRLLDRAVFKADQDGRVSVVGTANADTVAALLEWTVEGKAATVALAPLTAVLKVD